MISKTKTEFIGGNFYQFMGVHDIKGYYLIKLLSYIYKDVHCSIIYKV